MNKELSKLLKNNLVLKIVIVMTLVSMLSMLLRRKTKCLVTLVLTCLITKYFTNNVTIILLSGLFVTFMVSTLSKEVVENLENKEEGEEEEEEEKKKEELSNLSPASLDDEPVDTNNNVGKLNHAASVEAAYDNLDKILSSSALQNMSNDTERLVKKQENLMKQIKNFEPMMKQAEGMLKSFGDFDFNKLLQNKQ